MIFFEFSFRIKVEESNVLSSIKDFYPKRPIVFYPSMEYYAAGTKCSMEACCFVYQFLYSNNGFKTLFKGEIYNAEEQFSELTMAIFFSKKFESEIVIGDFTSRSSFLLIEPGPKIYRADSIGIGDKQYKNDTFEINYNSLSPAIDLQDR